MLLYYKYCSFFFSSGQQISVMRLMHIADIFYIILKSLTQSCRAFINLLNYICKVVIVRIMNVNLIKLLYYNEYY